jgi:hypothetical protein
MNLLDKSLGRLAVLAVALFFFSCEDPTSIGYKNPNPKFDVRYVDIPLTSSVMAIDSFPSDINSVGVASLLVGKYNDPLLGEVSAESYIRIDRLKAYPLADTSTFDYAEIRLHFNYVYQGAPGVTNQKIKIHRINEDAFYQAFKLINVKAPAVPVTTIFYSNRALAYSPIELAELNLTVDYTEAQKQLTKAESARDTIVVSARLDQDFGQTLFDNLKSDSLTRNIHFEKFLDQFRGIALVPDESATGISGFSVLSDSSYIKLHYHTPHTTGNEIYYAFDAKSFTSFSSNRAGTELAGHPNFEPILPSNDLRYVQSGDGITTRIDLSNFYQFANQDSVKNLLVNSAQIIVNQIQEPPAGIRQHDAFTLRVMDSHDFLLRSEKVFTSAEMQNLWIVHDNVHYYTYPDAEVMQTYAVSSLPYNATNLQYASYITRFTQALFRNKDASAANRINYLELESLSPNNARSVARTVFHKDGIHLRIYYTKPITSNQ